MADNFVAPCKQAAEALLSFQNITRDDVQRLTATSTTANNNKPENQQLYAQNYHEDFLAIVLDDVYKVIQVFVPLVAPMLPKRNERGRPGTSNIVYRDLVIIPDPETKKVPTHNACVALEKNKLIVSGFPFDRSWDAVTLKSNIRKQLPNQDMLFQYVMILPRETSTVEGQENILFPEDIVLLHSNKYFITYQKSKK